jgi:hypothetical protein
MVVAMATDRSNDPATHATARDSIAAQPATARPRLNVDVSLGDPISPKPANVTLPRVLGGEIIVRGYPLAMVHAKKIVTAIARGTTSTRWRDFADIYLLARHHTLDGQQTQHINPRSSPPSQHEPGTARPDPHRLRRLSQDPVHPPVRGHWSWRKRSSRIDGEIALEPVREHRRPARRFDGVKDVPRDRQLASFISA